MPIEAVAGDSIGNVASQADDVGPGAMGGDDTFTLPTDFDHQIDDGIEVPAEPPSAGSDGGEVDPTLRPPGATPPTGAPPQPAAQATPPQAPAQRPPAAAQPLEATPAQAPAAPAQTPAGGRGTERIYSPGELAQELGKNRNMLIDALAAQKFTLSPAETQALEVDAVGAIPKLLARVYYEASVNGLQQLANMVPRMVESVVTTRIGETQAEDAFHAEWPNIDRNNPQHMRAVEYFAGAYRGMNPTASQADAIKFVGHSVTSYFGLQQPQRINGSTPQRGATPARRGPPPFAPATGGRAAPLLGTPTVPQEQFAGLGLSFDGE